MAVIESKGNYYFFFDIDGDSSFTDGGGGIISFIAEEFAGGALPQFEFVFTTSDFKILKKINEGTVVSCTYGKSSDKTDTMELKIQKFEYTVFDTDYIRIELKGFIGTTTHLQKCEITGWKSKTSLDVIKDVAGIDYKVKSKASGTSDTQNWIRYNIPANRFIQEVWERSYISDKNFLVYAINRHGEFYIDDYLNATSGDEKWEFVAGETKGNKIMISPTYTIHSNHGLVNNVAVYKRERRVFNIETGGDSTKVSTPAKSPILASGSKINVQSSDPKNYGKVRSTHEAIHKNYHKALYNNSSKIALHGITEVEIETDSEYLPFELYDIAKFENWKIDPKDKDTELLSGLFLITRISRYWTNNRFRTAVTLSKDAMNNIKGELL